MPTWTRTVARRQMPSSVQIENAILRRVDQIGKEGVQALQTDIWAIRRFKRPTGRSTTAWTYRLKAANGKQEIRWLNDARTKRGVNYPRYVHLSGRPKSDLLMFEVQDWAQTVQGPKLGAACAEVYVDLRATMPVVKTTTKAG